MGETAESRATVSDRIRAIEDRLEIYNLIAGHPPSADTGADYYAETVYAEDGVFDRGEDLTGAAGGKKIAAMLQSPGHQAAISGGLAHFAGLPHIALNGDTATVTSYLQIIHPHPTAEEIELVNHGTSRGYRIDRVVATRWDLVRTDEGWRIKRRTLRPLDGSEPARALLKRALEFLSAQIARRRCAVLRCGPTCQLTPDSGRAESCGNRPAWTGTPSDRRSRTGWSPDRWRRRCSPACRRHARPW